MPLIHVTSRLILEGLIPWLLLVAQYLADKRFRRFWNAHGVIRYFCEDFTFSKIRFPMLFVFVYPLKSPPESCPALRRRGALSVLVLIAILYCGGCTTCISRKATASLRLFLSNFLRMRFPFRPVGRIGPRSYRPVIEFFDCHSEKPSEWFFFGDY